MLFKLSMEGTDLKKIIDTTRAAALKHKSVESRTANFKGVTFNGKAYN